MDASIVVTIGDSMYIVSGWQAGMILAFAILGVISVLVAISFGLTTFFFTRRDEV